MKNTFEVFFRVVMVSFIGFTAIGKGDTDSAISIPNPFFVMSAGDWRQHAAKYPAFYGNTVDNYANWIEHFARDVGPNLLGDHATRSVEKSLKDFASDTSYKLANTFYDYYGIAAPLSEEKLNAVCDNLKDKYAAFTKSLDRVGLTPTAFTDTAQPFVGMSEPITPEARRMVEDVNRRLVDSLRSEIDANTNMSKAGNVRRNVQAYFKLLKNPVGYDGDRTATVEHQLGNATSIMQLLQAYYPSKPDFAKQFFKDENFRNEVLKMALAQTTPVSVDLNRSGFKKTYNVAKETREWLNRNLEKFNRFLVDPENTPTWKPGSDLESQTVKIKSEGAGQTVKFTVGQEELKKLIPKYFSKAVNEAENQIRGTCEARKTNFPLTAQIFAAQVGNALPFPNFHDVGIRESGTPHGTVGGSPNHTEEGGRSGN